MNFITYALFKYFKYTVVLLGFLLLIAVRAVGQTSPTPIPPASILTEDFGGNTPSSAGSGDWWLNPGDTPNLVSGGSISSTFPYAEETGDILSNYGQKALSFNNIRYALTKVSEPLMNHGSITFNTGDHTSPDDDTRGYFVLFENHGNNQDDRTFYKYTATNVPAGHEIKLSVWVKSMWNITTFVLKAESDTDTQYSNEFSINQEDKWTLCSQSFSVADGGDVTLSVIVNHVGDGSANAAALDDITIDIVPINITPPLTAMVGENVELEGSYFYNDLGTTLKYRWEKKESGSDTWSIVEEDNKSTSSFTTSITTRENVVTTTFYRLLVSNDDFDSAIYSDVIEVYYSPYTYLFREDFKGNEPASYEGSGDWWIMPGSNDKPASGYESPGFPYAIDGGSNTYKEYYGLNEAQFWNKRYVYTKLSSALPSWLSYHTDDHTFSGDETKGYFALFENTFVSDEQPKDKRIFYEFTVPNLAVGEEYLFSAWLKTLSGTTPFIFEAKDGNGVSLAKEEFAVPAGGDWTQYNLLFTTISSSVTFTITVDAHIGENFGAIDDISVTLFEPMAYITSPSTNVVYCPGDNINLVADYRINNTSSIYRWQINRGSGWDNIDGANGTLNERIDQISYSIPFADPTIHSGRYRLQITEASDPNYTDPYVITSLNINDVQITVNSSADINLITNISQDSFCVGEITMTATVKSTMPTDYIIRWYFEGNSYVSDSNNSAKIFLTEPGTYDMQIGIEYPDYCEVRKDIKISVIDCSVILPDNTFGGCGAVNPFVLSGENTYTIPGFEYSLNASSFSDRPNISENKFIITKTTQQDWWDGGANIIGFKSITDHTAGCEGYFLQVHASSLTTANTQFYKNAVSVCGGSRISFSAWIANISRFIDGGVRNIKFNFNVSFNTGETYVRTTEVISNASDAEWKQYYFEFDIPDEASIALFTITPATDISWGWGYGFAMDDINIEPVNPVQITQPADFIINVSKGQYLDLTGYYKPDYDCTSLGDNITYKWYESGNGIDWESVTDGGNSILTDPIKNVKYYRLMVSDGISSRTSEIIKITPVTITSRTTWVCPDNMTDDEAGEDDINYRPSLIRLEVPELYGVTYNWYDKDGNQLPDVDEYEDSIVDEKAVFELVSDGKTNTISVENERNTQGIFENRICWVEICNINGDPFTGIERVPFYLRQSTICASLEAVLSPYEDNNLHRENFGGTSPTDPEISNTPLPNSNVDYIMHTGIDEENAEIKGDLAEGAYMLTKKAPTLRGGWYEIEDHLYDGDIANNIDHGYLMAVNSTEKRGRFYTYEVTNLGTCRDLELLFTGWFASPLNYPGSNKANLKFVLTDSDTGELLAEFLSGNLIDVDSGRWRQYGFRFFVPTGVENVTLEIINNNFRTIGGNDVLIDDIEIYLLMPPVKIIPSADQYVCPEEDNGNGSITLYGSYTDDGTLGKDLAYQWEFKQIEVIDGVETVVSDWQVVTGMHGTGTTDNGTFTTEDTMYGITDFTMAQNGYYRLVIGRKGAFQESGTLNYDCLAVSDSCKLILSTVAAPYPTPSLKFNETAFCYDDIEYTFSNQDSKWDEYNNNERGHFIWKIDTTEVKVNSNSEELTSQKLTLQLTNYKPGYHSVSLTAFNSVGCANTVTHNFIIYPRTTTWTAKGKISNWNDRDNWNNGVPGNCTNVIIPNDSLDITSGVDLLDHYPFLLQPTVETLKEGDYENELGNATEALKAYEGNQVSLERLHKKEDEENDFSLRPACDTITFKMGGSVARTDYLNYNFAYVDLDIKPGRWYTVSAPLRSMYSGDYFIEGNVKRQNPTVYMMKYNAKNPQTGDLPAEAAGDFSNPFNTLKEELYTGLGYAVRVKDETIPEVLQPFRFPKDSTKYAMWNYAGIFMGHVDVTTPSGAKRQNMGRFTYEGLIDMVDYSYDNERQLPESYEIGFEVTIEEDKDSYTTTMIGNPFMSYLDYTKFASVNGITSGYYIWTKGDTFEAIPNGNGFQSTTAAIAPMQSFIITENKKTLQFNFDMAIASPESASPLRARTRSADQETVLPSAIRLDILRDGNVHSNIRLRYVPDVDNSYDSTKDMWTLFSLDITEPAVLYALLNGKAASIRTLGNLSKPVELGIRTDREGPLTFRMSGMETIDTAYDIYLEDRLTGQLHDMRANAEYTFTHTTVNMQSRFFLHITNGIKPDDEGGEDGEEPSPTESDIRIFTTNHQITITSPATDPIETVRIYSMQGSMLHTKQTIGKSYVLLDLSTQEQVVIVEVTTKQHQKRMKLMIGKK